MVGLRGDHGEALDERCNFLFSVGGLKLFRFFFATTDDGAMMCGDNGTGGLFVQSSKQAGNDLMPPQRVELSREWISSHSMTTVWYEDGRTATRWSCPIFWWKSMPDDDVWLMYWLMVQVCGQINPFRVA